MIRVLGKTIRILLVEDDVDSARALSLLLTRMGYLVRTAATAAGAIELGRAEPFDLLLCDLGLPDRSGLDVLKELSAKEPVRAIAFTGYGSDEDIHATWEAGFLDHLVKPIDFQTLHVAIKRAISRPAVMGVAQSSDSRIAHQEC